MRTYQLEANTNLNCPRCGETELREVAVENALSRRDNETYVCSDCGLEEALVDAGMMEAREWVNYKEDN